MRRLYSSGILLSFFLIVSCASQESVFRKKINDKLVSITGQVVDAATGEPLPATAIRVEGSSKGTMADMDGFYDILGLSSGNYTLLVNVIGFVPVRMLNIPVKQNSTTQVDIRLESTTLESLEAISVVYGKRPVVEKSLTSSLTIIDGHSDGMIRGAVRQDGDADLSDEPFNTEDYDRIYENPFRAVKDNPLSTFSIDVDAASYSNIRRYITNGRPPPKDAVRIEEMINYFTYDYPQPTDEHPFSVITEVSEAPWNPTHKLVHIGIQGRIIPTENLPPGNLVFLIDVSGSMQDSNKLPLLKSAFRMLVDQLREEDRVSIVVYAGAAGLVLPPTAGNDKTTIIQSIDKLQAGGSTAGAEGIQLAYQIAQENFISKGNNRVILATDGDFNIGMSSDGDLVRLIESKRDKGIFLTVLGFGMGNYKDSKMEQLADKGNGNYAYIDNLMEARKVLVHEMGGTLFTIAKDVKIQVEFNPVHARAYRLIGYENRMLAKEDFNDDDKDAGELGSGHSVTALYEIIPIDAGFNSPPLDSLRYQTSQIRPDAYVNPELMIVKLRYKDRDGSKSRLLSRAILNDLTDLENSSENWKFSAAVAEFGLLLRDSQFKGNASYDQVLELASASKGSDEEGYRIAFINMVKAFMLIAK